MADVRPRSGPLALLLGFGCFVAFEGLAYELLRWLTSGLGEANQMQPENTIVSNWVKTIAFLLLHLALVLTATLLLNNRLPRRYRGQVMGWFYLSLLVGFGLLIPLFYS
ncbi:hypothetical protein HHL22_18490 [Hymenobacter sp. RP-2-7]|uniref:Uncharacterized protein n=1 Tax=Hymenobacter polaris TaxID=2682546 RepID=A0A7Y0FNR6_9BACT|nr:hypothetical protein [Hymenobacter polaris]NML67198.1 hypothetical protein [Hymenobacter polaris]